MLGKNMTEAQRKKLMPLIEKALELNEYLASRLLDNHESIIGGMFREVVTNYFSKKAESYCYPHNYGSQRRNECRRGWGEYPEEYEPKTVEEQIHLLRQVWPKLKPGCKIDRFVNKPEISRSEAWFAFPRWEKLAKTYYDALTKELFPVLYSQWESKFHSIHFKPKRIRQYKWTEQIYKALSAEQKGDILVLPAQFGKLHYAQSSNYARITFRKNEFGLGSFAVGCMLLTHPKRLADDALLRADCPGDEFSREYNSIDDAPFFEIRKGYLHFGASWAADCSPPNAPVSAFFEPR
jgi:hypothetical protein